jgi:nucleoid-associated protein YgaU
MTSDAKIGLLLGLIFIFIIAFVINGLPSLRPPLSKVGAATMVMPDEGPRGIDSGAGDAVGNWSDWLDQQKPGGDAPSVTAQTPLPVVQESMSEPAQTAAGPTQVAGDEGVRSTHALEDLLNLLTPIAHPEQGSATHVDQPRPAQEEPPATEMRPVATTEPARPVEAAPRVEPRESPRPGTVAKPLAGIPGSEPYVVVEGDTLPAIAKKRYGPEEGNRLANIERIFQANQSILKSPDMVIVGQKLIIPPPLPPLPKAPAAGPGTTSAVTAAPRRLTPAEVLPKTQFERPKSSSEPMTISEKVESLARRAPAAIPAPLPASRWYTVQEGDNLWRIAANQLGAGARWDEIYRLNSDVLPTEEALLKVGMRLRLPAK